MGIFGGGKSKSNQQSTSSNESGNHAYPYIQDTYGGYGATGNRASASINSLLGLGDDPHGDYQKAFGDYQNSTGFQDRIATGSKAITGNLASRGLLGSGATLKALDRFGQNAYASSFNDYIAHLLGQTQTGLQAGSLISGAGGYSNGQSQSTGSSTSTQNPDLSKLIGSIASAIPSDPRLKTDIRQVGEIEGLGVYDYRYVWDEEGTVRRGYMADEVKALRPDALGPELPGGYMTVVYDNLPEIGGRDE